MYWSHCNLRTLSGDLKLAEVPPLNNIFLPWVGRWQSCRKLTFHFRRSILEFDSPFLFMKTSFFRNVPSNNPFFILFLFFFSPQLRKLKVLDNIIIKLNRLYCYVTIRWFEASLSLLLHCSYCLSLLIRYLTPIYLTKLFKCNSLIQWSMLIDVYRMYRLTSNVICR